MLRTSQAFTRFAFRANCLFFILITVCAVENLPTRLHAESEGDVCERTEENAGSPEIAGDSDDRTVQVKNADIKELLAKFAAPSGQLVVVDWWSTSCVPCMREFPKLVELSKRFSGKVKCVSVNVDYIGIKTKPPETYLPKVEKFLKEKQAEFDNYLCTSPDERVFEEIEVESIPAIFVYDANGKLLAKFTDANAGDDGLSYESDVLPLIEKQLAEK